MDLGDTWPNLMPTTKCLLSPSGSVPFGYSLEVNNQLGGLFMSKTRTQTL